MTCATYETVTCATRETVTCTRSRCICSSLPGSLVLVPSPPLLGPTTQCCRFSGGKYSKVKRLVSQPFGTEKWGCSDFQDRLPVPWGVETQKSFGQEIFGAPLMGSWNLQKKKRCPHSSSQCFAASACVECCRTCLVCVLVAVVYGSSRLCVDYSGLRPKERNTLSLHIHSSFSLFFYYSKHGLQICHIRANFPARVLSQPHPSRHPHPCLFRRRFLLNLVWISLLCLPFLLLQGGEDS